MELTGGSRALASLFLLAACVALWPTILAQKDVPFVTRRFNPTTGPARTILFEPGRGSIFNQQPRPVPYRPPPPVVRLFVPGRAGPSRASPPLSEKSISFRKRENDFDILQPRFVLFNLEDDNEVSPNEESGVALKLQSYTTTCPKLRDTVELRCEAQTNSSEPLVWSWKRRLYPGGHEKEVEVVKDGRLLTKDSRYSLRATPTGHALSITNFSTSDCCSFECVASVGQRKASSQLLLLICH